MSITSLSGLGFSQAELASHNREIAHSGTLERAVRGALEILPSDHAREWMQQELVRRRETLEQVAQTMQAFGLPEQLADITTVAVVCEPYLGTRATDKDAQLL